MHVVGQAKQQRQLHIHDHHLHNRRATGMPYLAMHYRLYQRAESMAYLIAAMKLQP